MVPNNPAATIAIPITFCMSKLGGICTAGYRHETRLCAREPLVRLIVPVVEWSSLRMEPDRYPVAIADERGSHFDVCRIQSRPPRSGIQGQSAGITLHRTPDLFPNQSHLSQRSGSARFDRDLSPENSSKFG